MSKNDSAQQIHETKFKNNKNVPLGSKIAKNAPGDRNSQKDGATVKLLRWSIRDS